MTSRDLDSLTRADSWDGVRAFVAGFGVAGFAAADNLTHLGASVVAVDERTPDGDPDLAERAELLGVLGADVRLGAGTADMLPDDVDVLVVSPAWRPDAALVMQAHVRGVPVWGEVELAWRLRDPAHRTPWLAVTGSRGRSRTVRMVDGIFRAAGLRSTVAGNVGLSLVEVVMEPDPYDVITLDLSAAQLHHTSSMSAQSAAVLGMGEQGVEHFPAWHPDWESYCNDTARVYHQVERACIYNVADERTRRMVEDADVVEGARAIGFTLGMPGVGMVGLVEDIVADRAFIEQRETSAAELCTLGDLASDSPEFVADALAAATLARSHGVPQAAVRDGLRAFRDDPEA